MASGIETQLPFAYVVQYAHGKAIRVRAYLDHDEALEAAGLSREATLKPIHYHASILLTSRK